ncbi:cell surface glycoprotein MUC18-like isoform X3 [Lethenteron reissneri]|uniref:cell surface glycoprotein MUC18-like isoform X3 n=1 Tax=Lethenteron reissneri TaxID=7753 RepID=UPI002AB6D9EC|nr:cell surface glycoprotein MUC18-like isoform X3 [Lethenteron reissneri]
MGVKAACCFLFALATQPGVADSIVVTTTPPTVDIEVGESLKIKCSWERGISRVDSNDPQLAWFIPIENTRQRILYKQGRIEQVDLSKFGNRISIQDEFTLVINNTIPSDSGYFICTVSAGVEGAGEAKTRVNVCSPPQVHIIGKHEPVQANKDTVEIGICVTEKVFPRPNITWYKNTTPFDPELHQRPVVEYDEMGFMTVRSSLNYKPQKADRDATYHCRISYKMPGLIQTMDSQRINITVHYPAERVELVIWEPKGATHVTEGDDVVLRCVADANPPSTFAFYNNGTQILDGVIGDKMTFNDIERSQMAEYSCVALTNIVTAVPGGKLEAKLFLDVREDKTTTIIIAVTVSLAVLIATATVLGLFYTKKLCFASKGDKPKTENDKEEDIPMKNSTSLHEFSQPSRLQQSLNPQE